MSMKFLSRRYRILLLIGIAGSLFLCFQFFSFQVISLSGRRQQGNQGQVGHQARVLDSDVIDKLKDKNLVLGSDKQRYNETVKQFHSDKQRYNETVKQTVHVGAGLMDRKNADGFKKSEGYHLVRGTHLHQAEDYRDRNGMFQCITSKEMIPFSQVNDDFCDCKDSTDEPGTSACPQSMFFCTFQNGKEPPQYIQGSRVNDGVCDCCDGSDEWMGLQVFAGVHLTDKRYEDTLHQTPCRDTCVAVQQSQAEDARIRERGRRLKHTYLEAGKKVRETDVYGPDGVFYQLSVTCFDHETTEYKYTLCPFKSVSQQNFPSPPVNLGRKPRWRTRLGGVYVLKMEGGDVNACPGGKQRQTLITFICGLADRILDVREDEKCVYGMRFSTPAAC